MKKTLLTLAIALFTGVAVMAQAPNGFNYQGIVRNTSGAPIANTPIMLRLTIHDNIGMGTVYYEESWHVTTNTFGLYNVVVGQGTVISGTFDVAHWGNVPKFLQVEVDQTNVGTSFTDLGSTQLMSVPYALVAANGPTGATGATGPTGLMGPKGDSGRIGLQGPPGPGKVDTVIAGPGLLGGIITKAGTISMPYLGTPGTYGSSTTVPIITTDAQGRVTSVVPAAIPGDNWGSQVVQVGSTLFGDGTTGFPITLANMGATVGQVLQWNGLQWVPAAVSGTGTVTSVATSAPLTGGPITSSGTIGLATSGVTAGPYGSGTQVPVITVNSFGLVTSATTAPVSIGALLGDVIGSSSTTKVVGLQGTPVSATAPTPGQTLAFNAGAWTPTTGVSTSGTANYIPMFTSATNLGNSKMYQSPTGTNMVGLGTTTPKATFNATSATDSMAGWLVTSSAAPASNHGIMEVDYAGTTNAGIGIVGNTFNVATNNNTYGVQGIGTAIGMQGIAQTSATGGAAVKGMEATGFCNGAFSMGIGGYGNNIAPGAPATAYGVVGNAVGGTVNYSGFFVGDVSIGGTMTASGKAFKIDDPIDPANKYLYHSCVESSDMMNIYNGNVTTDASGVATVALPAYFDALNKDCRYQLTVIGGTFAQAIISKEEAGNSFEIKTNAPNTKVSWQVTGIRKDPYAAAHTVIGEVDKESFNKGKYLDAKDYGQPESMQIGNEVAHPSQKALDATKSTTAQKTQK